MFHGQFGEITSRPGPLDFLVTANASERPVGPDKFPLSAEITPPQDELHQVTHRNSVDWFCHGFAHKAFPSSSNGSMNSEFDCGSVGDWFGIEKGVNRRVFAFMNSNTVSRSASRISRS
jgi:hypothetical protein